MHHSPNAVLKLLTIAAFLWFLFFLNLILPKLLEEVFVFNPVVWNFLYLILLVCALVVTLVLIAESFRRERPFLIK